MSIEPCSPAAIQYDGISPITKAFILLICIIIMYYLIKFMQKDNNGDELNNVSK